MQNATVILTMLVAILAGCSTSPVASLPETESLQPTVAEIATAYPTYRKITDTEVYVNLELAMLCRGANQTEVEAAQIKHGPHANTAILIYMNPPAAEAFKAGARLYPVGAVIVKHKSIHSYRDSASGEWIRGSDNGVGGMVKRPAGFDPAHGNWEYFYFENVTQIESGRINSCIQCHEATKSTDYVFGTWRKTGD